jgi:ABC-type bacteriocin/lantibiotic exporter with double-glycine peptidase domain
VKPLIDPLDLKVLRDRCDGAVCLQSSFSTCGPATAATILRGFGQNVTEKDLALESFTSRGGTEAWYLARALRKRGNATEFVFSDSALPYPAVAGVRLQGDTGHFIAILNEQNETYTVVDPLSGAISLNANDLRKKYHFTGFFMTIAPPHPSQM